jgi:hypothetical protein
VVEGYGLLQPRVTTSLPLENASRYERLCSGEPGIDPYTRTVSDVYQDLFGEGSFTGKGIYDLDSVRARAGRTLPRQPGAVARPAGGQLPPFRPAERRPGGRSLSAALQRRRRPAPPLDPRRLAAGRLAARPGAAGGWPARKESAAAAGALEAVRQPAPQPGRADPDRPAGPVLGAAAGTELLERRDPVGVLPADDPGRADRPGRQGARHRTGPAPGATGRRARASAWAMRY